MKEGLRHTGEARIPGLKGERCHFRMLGQAPQDQAIHSRPHLFVWTVA